MQKIEYKESPSPHVIIKNFLPETAARECLAEAQWLEPEYHPAHVLGGMNHLNVDDCEECREMQSTLKLAIRSNDIVFLDGTFYSNKELLIRDTSKIPHPYIKDTMRLLENLSFEDKKKIHFKRV